jgi:hypothetical protein
MAAAMMKVPGVVGVHFPSADTVVFATREPDATYSGIVAEAVGGGFAITAITSPDASLEALFHYLVERGARMAGTGADAGVGSVTAPRYQSQLEAGGGKGASQ